MTSDSTRIGIDKIPIYNPGRLSDDEVIAGFVARNSEFERIVEDLRAETPTSRAQHHLVIGQRGMGKTTLLMRLAAELRSPPFDDALVPLVFAEEQYEVDRLSKFWLNCLDSLADELERTGAKAETKDVDDTVRALERAFLKSGQDEDDFARRCLDEFLATTERVGRRPVLLVDNIQIVFDRIGRQEHALREVLQRAGSPILVAASPSPPAQSQDYGAAFYDQFKTHYLRPLSVVDMRELIARFATLTGRDNVASRVRTDIGRLAALHQLTGGNPRTAALLFHLYAKDFAPSVFGDLEQLLDRVTPLYKARLEELSDQAQVVVTAIANHWAPVGAGPLAEIAGLKKTTISSQLDRLRKTGVVEAVALSKTTKSGYQLAERFFNVWLLMRSGSRRQRRKVEFLTRFLEVFYEPEERSRLAYSVAKEQAMSPDRAVYAISLSATLDDDCAKQELERSIQLGALAQTAREARRELEEVLDLSQLPPATLEFAELREKLASLVVDLDGVDPEEFVRTILGSRDLFVRGERERLASKERLSSEEWASLAESVGAVRRRDVERFGEEAVEWFEERLAGGQLLSPADTGDWNRTIERSTTTTDRIVIETLAEPVATLVNQDALSVLLDRNVPAEDASADGWAEWASRLTLGLARHDEAERAYRRAIEIDPKFAFAWCNLGNLLSGDLGRHEEAEEAYRRAIELDPKDAHAWFNLGYLLSVHFDRNEEAEESYCRAIEIDPKDAYAWFNLGNLLCAHFGQYEEAEEAYRRAIEIDAKFAYSWNGLGSLNSHVGRYEEAEEAYRRAIEIDAKFAHPWNGLGNLLRDHLGRYEEAEQAYRRAIAIDPKSASSWNGLGNLLILLLRFDEACEAFERSLSLLADGEAPIGNLIFVHRDFLGTVVKARDFRLQLDEIEILRWPELRPLHDALFVAYDINWGLATKALEEALDMVDGRIPTSSRDDWCRAAAVLIHLDYGGELVDLLEERGDDDRLRPWYEAIRAHVGGGEEHLLDIPVEVRPTATWFFEEMDRVLGLLPESTRRRTIPASKGRRKR